MDRRPRHRDRAARRPGDAQRCRRGGGPRPGSTPACGRSPRPRSRRRRCRRPGSARRRAPRHEAGSLPSSTVATLTLTRSGKSGSFSISGPSRSRSTASQSSTKKMTCGLPTLTANGSRRSSQPTGIAAVSIAIGERDLVPSEAGRAHVDRGRLVAGRAGDDPALGLDRACPAEQQRDAARGIAAGLDLAAVGVADAHPDVGRVGRLEQDELVAADPGAAVGESARGRSVHRRAAPARASKTTKSLPSPCILWKRRVIAGRSRVARRSSPPWVQDAASPVLPGPVQISRQAIGGKSFRR